MSDKDRRKMSERSRKIDKNTEGMVKVVSLLALDENLRERFLEDAGETLEELGVKIEDKELLKKLTERIKEIIIDEILVEREGFDPIGPVADVTIGAAVLVGVVTGASTAAATAVVSVTMDDRLAAEGKWEKVEVDFGRIAMVERTVLNDLRVRALEGKIRSQKSEVQR